MAKTLLETWEEMEAKSTERAILSGKPDDGPVPWYIGTFWTSAVGAVLRILKESDPEKLPAAVWRIERDLEEIRQRQADRLVADPEKLFKILDQMAAVAPKGDGASTPTKP